MSIRFAGGVTPARSSRDWLSLAIGLVVLVAVGVVMGQQYVTPDKRVLAVVSGLLVLGITWRLDLMSGVGLLILILPYPRNNVYGSTNLAFILLMMIVWLLRINTGAAARPRGTPLDQPIIGLVFAYVISFYNVENTTYLGFALANFGLFLACIALYYLIVNAVRSPEQLARLHLFQAATVATVCLVALFELNHPGSALVPGWIDFRQTHGEALDTRNIRVGGPFFDFEQLSDFCAVNILLVLFLLLRARTTARKVLFGVLLALVIFILFATVTRGAIIALGVGLVYLVWVLRREVRFVSLMSAIGLVVAGFAAMDFYVANFTRSGDLFKRLSEGHTLELKNGLPVGRAATWIQAFDRWLEHPIIGHGPYYSLEKGITFWYWPHNVYLFIANLVGVVGLSFFLWLMWRMWRLSGTHATGTRDPNYARAWLVYAHVQLLVFAIDQTKIDYLRSPIYQFQVWVMFALLMAGVQLSRRVSPEPASA